ncbi:MAG: hypothetical protein CM15mP120_09610 [Pseudomonadota bacterium]|nr:MAG: hypothetical protein CM15mP120_09610 [Pseudomonadota bacterium]
MDGSVEEGTADPYGRPWVMREGRFPGDNSLFTLYSAPVGGMTSGIRNVSLRTTDPMFRAVRTISHWAGYPDDMQGFGRCPRNILW